MRAINLNRITIVLAFLGLFIAGTLSLGKLMNSIPPCGSASSGCLTVETDPSSAWFGIPVAYFGFGAYLTLAALAVLRHRKGLAPSRALVNVGYAVSAIGLMVSAYLTYYALSELKATCLWCLSSALTMTALFITHAVLAQEDLPSEPVAGGDFKLISGAGVVAVVALAGMGFQLKTTALNPNLDKGGEYKKKSYEDFVPKGAHVQGMENAPLTVVEFGDLYCPACRNNYEAIHGTIESTGGRIKFVFRHMPMHKIPGHEFALSAAILSEVAAEQGKFWEYLAGAYAIQEEPKDLKPFMGVFTNLGLNADKLDEKLTNPNDPAFKKVYEDLKFAEKTGVRGTPSFFVLRAGHEPEAMTATGVKEWLAGPEVAPLIPKG